MTLLVFEIKLKPVDSQTLFIYCDRSADLTSACGRLKNTAKEKQPALATAYAGFFVCGE